jgi:hypothetical protein
VSTRIRAHAVLALHSLAERWGVSVEHLQRLGGLEILIAFGEAVAAPEKQPSASGVFRASEPGPWEQDRKTPVVTVEELRRKLR